MVVAAIVIPILFIYFYFLTSREKSKQIYKWKRVGVVPEESRIMGKVDSIQQSTERFYQNYKVVLFIFTITSDDKRIRAVKKMPLGDEVPAVDIDKTTPVIMTGRWNKQTFLINKIQNIG